MHSLTQIVPQGFVDDKDQSLAPDLSTFLFFHKQPHPILSIIFPGIYLHYF